MTVSEIIDRLGGTTVTARLFGVTPAAVSNWRQFGAFPERLHFRVYRECEARGITLPPDFFGPPPESASAGAVA